MTVIDISLLVCTRDRCAGLAGTLASINRACAEAFNLAVEVIVVDNGSTDDTPALLREWRADQDYPIHLVHEAQAGLARARNAGLAFVRGRVVAMTDDDCVLHPDYFTALAGCFAARPDPIVIGGRIMQGDPADLPLTVKLEDHAMEAASASFPGGFVMGANLAFTAAVLTRIGQFDPRFGAGARFLAAEDTDFLFRALGAGIPVCYQPCFAVDHHHGRRCHGQAVRLLAGYSFGDGAMYAKHILRDRRIVGAIAGDLRNLLLDLGGSTMPWTGIRRFHLFCLRHKIAGFAAYVRMWGGGMWNKHVWGRGLSNG